MFRRATNYLLILLVLGCPLTGLSETLEAAQYTRGWRSDAQSELEKPAGHCPICPCSRHDPRSCFCAGAVVEARLEQRHGQLELPAFPFALSVSDTLLAVGHLDARASTCLPDFLSPFSGRQILALTECLRL